MKQLDPKAVWLFFFSRVVITPIMFVIFFTMASLSFGYVGILYGGNFDFSILILLVVILLLLSIVFNFFWSTLIYKNYKYELRADGFRKEHGVISKKYVTIPYERIQNVDIYRGLLSRILGLSDLNIQTAGMSTTVGSYGGGSEGRLPALDPKVAEELRDELVARARGKSQGL